MFSYRVTGVHQHGGEHEERFKVNVLGEVRQGDGRILLHDEVEERTGIFSIIPIWEMVSEEDIMTPGEYSIWW